MRRYRPAARLAKMYLPATTKCDLLFSFRVGDGEAGFISEAIPEEELMANLTRRGFLGSLSGAAAATSLAAQPRGSQPLPEMRTGRAPIKITDLKCAIIGRNPVVRVVTDQGISGYGQAESMKNYLKPMVRR
jgi:hypothetical protein